MYIRVDGLQTGLSLICETRKRATYRLMPNLHFLEETTSTNSWMQAALDSNAVKPGDAVYTFSQTEGRGQKGNRWFSEPGKNLLFSLLIEPKALLATEQFRLSMMLALALKNLLDEDIPNLCVKWPNDLYAGNRKLAGMLLENRLAGKNVQYAIAGIGLNVNQSIFPEELSNPVSMVQLTGDETELHDFAARFYQGLSDAFKRLELCSTETLKRDYMKALFRNSGLHPYRDSNGTFFASIENVTELGYLVLKTAEGELRSYEIKTLAFLTNSVS